MKGKLALSFKVTPAMGSGKVSLASVPKKGKKKITLGTKTFKLGSSGKVGLRGRLRQHTWLRIPAR